MYDSLEDKILDACRNNSKYLMNLKNVNGLGLGYRYVNNSKTSELCLNVLVENKMDMKYLSRNNIIPSYYMGLKTDVIMFKRPKICGEALSNKIRPVEGGYGISCNNISGTIGCIVTKQIGKRTLYYILSNNHVIAGKNKTPLGSIVIQPSIKNGGDLKLDKVAILNNFIPIRFKTEKETPINYVDCAIARLFNPETISDRIATVGKVKGKAKAVLNQKIKKVGKMTGKTEGEVTIIGAELLVDVDNDIALFSDQVIAKIESLGGDSGSAVLNEANEIIGLFFAGISQNDKLPYTIGIINDIDRVLDSFEVKIYQSDK